jgi:hypothetical protein
MNTDGDLNTTDPFECQSFFPSDSNKIAGKNCSLGTQSDGIFGDWSNSEKGFHPLALDLKLQRSTPEILEALRSCPFGTNDLVRPITDLDYDEARAPDVSRGFMDGDIVPTHQSFSRKPVSEKHFLRGLSG